MFSKWLKKEKEKSHKELFTDQWIEDWKEAINISQKYRSAGKFWNAPVVLSFNPVPEVLRRRMVLGFTSIFRMVNVRNFVLLKMKTKNLQMLY